MARENTTQGISFPPELLARAKDRAEAKGLSVSGYVQFLIREDLSQPDSRLNREVQDKQKDVMDGFRDKLEAVVGKVAKRLGLQIVVDSSKGGATLYREDRLDISNQVIEEFNRDYP